MIKFTVQALTELENSSSQRPDKEIFTFYCTGCDWSRIPVK